MKVTEIIDMQKTIGTTPDGEWGPLSRAALRSHLMALAPAKSPWPRTDRSSLEAFYGRPGDEANLVSFDFPFPMFYEGRRVLTSRCHRRVRDSLLRVLRRIGDRYGHLPGVMEEAQDYGGIYNFRNMRGSDSTLSTHAWGIAIDLDADDNSLRGHWPRVSDMPLAIIEEFTREGWYSIGAFEERDAMHFQATCIPGTSPSQVPGWMR